jgi:serine phosphatase RsbU (regulator of sigma subunit)/PAS domain-containing protein
MGEMSPSGPDLLDPPLLQALRETGAFAGMVYLLDPRERVLRLSVLAGLSPGALRPWTRLGLDARLPVPDTVRNKRLIWLAVGQMARRYPQVGMIMPYAFALASAPLVDGDTCWGALPLLWSARHPSELGEDERAAIDDACARMTGLRREAERAGRPIRPGSAPRVAERRRAPQPGPAEAQGAADFAEQLPEGGLALDLDGRVVFATRNAAQMLGVDAADLSGAPLWEVLPWLSDPVFEDRYRSALFSRQPGSFTVRRPPDHWLRFELHPGAFGISVRIARVSAGDEVPGAAAEEGAPTRAGVLYHLMHLATTLTEAVTVQDVVDLVAGQIMPALDAQGLMLFLAEGGRLKVIGSRGYGPELQAHFHGQPMTPARLPAARVLLEETPRFYASPEEMEKEYEGLAAVSGKSAWAMLPLMASGRAVGCAVISYTQPHPFTADERGIFTSLAGLIAQALERARLYDAKHQLARRLQAGLLPRELPTIPGVEVAVRYLAATEGIEIGGDFYDLIPLGRGRGDSRGGASVSATIGDVQGHNVTAAALMGQVRTAVHASAGAPPGEVLRRANRLLTDLDPGLFTSCLYMDFDLPGKRARMATAGHLPPLLRYPDGRVTTLRITPGPLLGIDARADYPAMELEMPPGSVLLMYTDGLIERPGTDLDDSIAELAGVFAEAGSEPLNAVADALLARAGQADSRSDDIAMLLLRPR